MSKRYWTGDVSDDWTNDRNWNKPGDKPVKDTEGLFARFLRWLLCSHGWHNTKGNLVYTISPPQVLCSRCKTLVIHGNVKIIEETTVESLELRPDATLIVCSDRPLIEFHNGG